MNDCFYVLYFEYKTFYNKSPYSISTSITHFRFIITYNIKQSHFNPFLLTDAESEDFMRNFIELTNILYE